MSSDKYKFAFNTTDPSNPVVTNLWEVEYKRGVEKLKAQNTSGHTFDTEQNGSGAVVEVTDQYTNRKGFIETSIYDDADANGVFVQNFEVEVAGPTTNAARLEQHKFTINNGVVTQDLELNSRGNWKVDAIKANETYQQQTINGVDYIIKFETERNGGVDFEVFKNGNNDAVWTQVADGEAKAGVDVVGLLTDHGLLNAASGIVG